MDKICLEVEWPGVEEVRQRISQAEFEEQYLTRHEVKTTHDPPLWRLLGYSSEEAYLKTK